jgi:hypothetical protein
MGDKGTRTAISAIAIEKTGSMSSFSVVQLTYFPEKGVSMPFSSNLESRMSQELWALQQEGLIS